MGYTTQHTKNILSEKQFSKSNLVPGAIIRFTYIDVDKKTSRPLVLVLNPGWEGNLHGLALDEIPERALQKLVDVIKLWYSKKTNDLVKLRLPLIKVNTGPPKSFYSRTLKPVVEQHMKKSDPYREYKLNRISTLKIVEYKFALQTRLDEETERKRQLELKQLAIQAEKLERSKQ